MFFFFWLTFLFLFNSFDYYLQLDESLQKQEVVYLLQIFSLFLNAKHLGKPNRIMDEYNEPSAWTHITFLQTLNFILLAFFHRAHLYLEFMTQDYEIIMGLFFMFKTFQYYNFIKFKVLNNFDLPSVNEVFLIMFSFNAPSSWNIYLLIFSLTIFLKPSTPPESERTRIITQEIFRKKCLVEFLLTLHVTIFVFLYVNISGKPFVINHFALQTIAIALYLRKFAKSLYLQALGFWVIGVLFCGYFVHWLCSLKRENQSGFWQGFRNYLINWRNYETDGLKGVNQPI